MENSEQPLPSPAISPPWRHDRVLYLPDGARLPTDTCIHCGHKAVKVISKSIRNPWNPATWFSRQTIVDIGLCKKHKDDNNVGKALTYSVLSIGVIIFITGVVTVGIVTLIIGLLAIVVSGIFRARTLIYTSNTNVEPLPIKGAAASYLEQFPSFEVEEDS